MERLGNFRPSGAAYGQGNDGTCCRWFDTALTTMAMERGILRAPGQSSIGLCVASGCEFLAPIGFPETVDIRLTGGGACWNHTH